MLILSDCMTERADEGTLKIANSLAKRIKKRDAETRIVSYGNCNKYADRHMKLNRLFLNRSLLLLIRKHKERILYIPFASNTKASAIRTWILSIMSKEKIQVLFTLRHPMENITCLFLEKSNVEIIVLSKDSEKYYRSCVRNKVIYLKTGVDTYRFVPVNTTKKVQLRQKYKVAEDKKVLLHVGHLHAGRNVDKLEKINDCYHIFLVISSVTENMRDPIIEQRLRDRPNTTIIDSYVEHIEEMYQMADVYVFPVQKEENCIDVPLSVLEAAACNIPVVCTEYGELKEFKGEPGFCFLSTLEPVAFNQAIDRMSELQGCENRRAVLDYDWDISLNALGIQGE